MLSPSQVIGSVPSQQQLLLRRDCAIFSRQLNIGLSTNVTNCSLAKTRLSRGRAFLITVYPSGHLDIGQLKCYPFNLFDNCFNELIR